MVNPNCSFLDIRLLLTNVPASLKCGVVYRRVLEEYVDIKDTRQENDVAISNNIFLTSTDAPSENLKLVDHDLGRDDITLYRRVRVINQIKKNLRKDFQRAAPATKSSSTGTLERLRWPFSLHYKSV